MLITYSSVRHLVGIHEKCDGISTNGAYCYEGKSARKYCHLKGLRIIHLKNKNKNKNCDCGVQSNYLQPLHVLTS